VLSADWLARATGRSLPAQLRREEELAAAVPLLAKAGPGGLTAEDLAAQTGLVASQNSLDSAAERVAASQRAFSALASVGFPALQSRLQRAGPCDPQLRVRVAAKPVTAAVQGEGPLPSQVGAGSAPVVAVDLPLSQASRAELETHAEEARKKRRRERHAESSTQRNRRRRERHASSKDERNRKRRERHARNRDEANRKLRERRAKQKR